MKVVISICLLLVVGYCKAQEFDFDLLSVNGLKLFASKAEIIKVLGDPEEVTYPEYECGFLSSQEQGKKFETLNYPSLKFTGKEGSSYIAEEVLVNDEIELRYRGKVFNRLMNLDQLIEIFGMELMGNFHDTYTGSKLFRNSNSDDGISFVLLEGKLVKIEYWSPC